MAWLARVNRITLFSVVLIITGLLLGGVFGVLDGNGTEKVEASEGPSSLLRRDQADVPSSPAGTVYRVTVTGSGDGSNWANATNLQNVLNSAGSGDEVWVAAGLYTPGPTVTDTFYLLLGVGIYGGFAATETQRNERDWLANPTILSGDIGGDDVTDASGVVSNTAHISGSNSYHVVTADGTSGVPITETTILDGFTITAGQADRLILWPYNSGAGFFCNG